MASSVTTRHDLGRWSERLPTALSIRISRGVGTGITRLAAFDQALQRAGVADFNLLRLSSVIPPGAEVQESSAGEQIQGGHGDLLYCVYADAYATLPGQSAWAGITWARHEDGSGAGLLAEHGGPTREAVERDLRHSLEAMISARPAGFSREGMVLSSTVCESEPVCAVVIATFHAASWDHVRRA